MEHLIDKALKELMCNSLVELEEKTNSDVLSYFGPILDGNENTFLEIIEDLAKDPHKRNNLSIILTTTGGT